MEPRRDGLGAPAPSTFRTWAITAVLALAWMAVRVLAGDYLLPLTFVVPLLACVWTRSRAALWAMAAFFMAAHTAHLWWYLPASALVPGAFWPTYLTTIANIAVGATLVHLVIGLRDRLETAVRVARAAEDRVRAQSEELQAQSEELAQQNAELSEQSEELAQQNEELQVQAEEIHGLNEDLSKREALLEGLLEAARVSADEASALDRICLAARSLVVDAAAAVVFEREDDSLTVRAVASAWPSGVTPPSVPLDTGFASLVVREGRTASLNDAALRPDLPTFRIEGAEPFRSVLCAPLRAEGRVIGALAVYGSSPREWTEDEFQLADWLAHQCAASLGMLRLQASLARRAALLDLSPDAIIVRRRDGTITYWSRGAEAMYGYTSGEAVGRVTHELLQTRFSKPRHAIEEELERTGRWTGELVHRARDGREVFVEGRWMVERGPDGRGSDVLESNVDVTMLREADRRKSEFLATLSHELRNPLAAMRYALELLGRLGGSPPARPLGVIERQLAHLVRLVDDLLDVARVGSNKFQLRRQRVELAAVVQQAVDAVAPEVGRQGHVLDVSLPERAVALDGDADRLAQVVINLLTNAVRYTPANGRIGLDVTTTGSEATIRVSDTGVGLSGEELPRVFDMFTQFASAGQGGLGIGLALVKAVVELHGGTVAAESDGAGKGSTFTVRLPLGAAPAVPGAGAAAAPASGPPQRILVVEDNADVAEMIDTALGLDGHLVRVARSGQLALDALADFAPDIALLDIGLPDFDGYELARRLRADPRTQTAYLVAITGWGQDGDRQRARDVGFDAHLTKPVEFSEIARVIAAAERRSRSEGAGAAQPRG